MAEEHELLVDVFKSGKSASKAMAILKDIFGPSSLNRSQVYVAPLKARKDGLDG